MPDLPLFLPPYFVVGCLVCKLFEIIQLSSIELIEIGIWLFRELREETNRSIICVRLFFYMGLFNPELEGLLIMS